MRYMRSVKEAVLILMLSIFHSINIPTKRQSLWLCVNTESKSVKHFLMYQSWHCYAQWSFSPKLHWRKCGRCGFWVMIGEISQSNGKLNGSSCHVIWNIARACCHVVRVLAWLMLHEHTGTCWPFRLYETVFVLKSVCISIFRWPSWPCWLFSISTVTAGFDKNTERSFFSGKSSMFFWCEKSSL